MLSLQGRVDFTCLNYFSQTHFASAVEHDLVNPKRRTRSFMKRGSRERQSDTFQSSCQL